MRRGRCDVVDALTRRREIAALRLDVVGSAGGWGPRRASIPSAATSDLLVESDPVVAPHDRSCTLRDDLRFLLGSLVDLLLAGARDDAAFLAGVARDREVVPDVPPVLVSAIDRLLAAGGCGNPA